MYVVRMSYIPVTLRVMGHSHSVVLQGGGGLSAVRSSFAWNARVILALRAVCLLLFWWYVHTYCTIHACIWCFAVIQKFFARFRYIRVAVLTFFSRKSPWRSIVDTGTTNVRMAQTEKLMVHTEAEGIHNDDYPAGPATLHNLMKRTWWLMGEGRAGEWDDWEK